MNTTISGIPLNHTMLFERAGDFRDLQELGASAPEVLAGYHDGGGKHAELRKRISSF